MTIRLIPPTDATWLPHRYDPAGDAFHFVPVTRAQHRAISFLTDEYLPQAKTPSPIGRLEAMAQAAPAGPVHFIFHSAFCCSTLLVRALDRDGLVMGLSEPVVLNDIVGWRHRGATEVRQIADVMDNSLALLSRPFQNGEAIVIKPSNLVNPLAAAFMALRPESRALALYAPLEDFLGSIARKGLWGRIWVRDLYGKLLREGHALFGMDADQQLRLTDIQVAAVCWLAQHQIFLQLIDRYGSKRVRSLDSETLTDDPAKALENLSLHFGLPASPEAVEAMANGPAFSRHSKSGSRFSAADRQKEKADGLSAHADEVGKVLAWAKELAIRSGTPLELPARLLP